MGLRFRLVVVLTTTALALGVGSSAAGARGPDAQARTATEPLLTWTACGTTPEGTGAGVECAVADLPMDHDQPEGDRVQIAVARVPATDAEQRIGALFFNFGGPGGPAVDYLQAVGPGIFAALAERFDIVTFDPRGVGQSVPSVDCAVDQETQGIYSVPVPTPLTIDVDAYLDKVTTYLDACLAANGEILAHLSTANVARDMDAIRAGLGEEQISYLGFSYGTHLGATYGSLFPDRYRTLVLDGAVNAEGYMNDPISDIAAQTAAFERGLARFLEACGVDQEACSGFGGDDPTLAYDRLVAAAERDPIPAEGFPEDPRPVSGDDIRTGTLALLYAKQAWGLLGAALAEAAAGDGSTMREIVDFYYGREPDGTFDPLLDRYFLIGAAEQDYPRDDVELYLDRGEESWVSYPHFWANSGYAELNYALWPVRDEDAYYGPFTLPETSPPALVIGTTYDVATPYAWAQQLTADLGNARLLTMEGDGHTAYAGNSACIDEATDTYLLTGTLPAEGATCTQEVPFEAPEPSPAQQALALELGDLAERLRVLRRG